MARVTERMRASGIRARPRSRAKQPRFAGPFDDVLAGFVLAGHARLFGEIPLGAPDGPLRAAVARPTPQLARPHAAGARRGVVLDGGDAAEIGTYIENIIDNIGLPYSGINLSYSNSAPTGSQRCFTSSASASSSAPARFSSSTSRARTRGSSASCEYPPARRSAAAATA